MRAAADRVMLSPSDLSNFLACPHLTQLDLSVARGELRRPFRPNRHAELIRRKGDEHERAYLRLLASHGRRITRIGAAEDDTAWDFDSLARETAEAIDAGADVVYQATFVDGAWRGRADFLERQPDGSYHAVDTKLARHARPSHVLQLCFYTEQLARLLGHQPAAMDVVNGLGERESFRPDDFVAYYRRLKRRFEAAVATTPPTYPYPVEHCGLCEFISLCEDRWRADDHLTLVAGVARSQHDRLAAAGIHTLAALAATPPETRVLKLRDTTFEKLRHQAELQLHHRTTGEHRVDTLPLEPGRGFSLLPEPSAGDMWLDLEGHPWFEPARGLEFLFGWVARAPDSDLAYDCLWATDHRTEKEAFERLVDVIVERRRRHPGMHVYHYAQYERVALRRLAGQHGTREEEVDDLLRGDVLVDLYQVTRQALRASVPSYSIKKIEELYGFRRSADVSGGTEAVGDFELWLETEDETLREGIRTYNEEDCRSTYELHRWLLAQRPRDLPWRPPPEDREPPTEEAQAHRDERERVRAQLLEGRDEGHPDWLLAQLLVYHQREARPQWWEYFHHLSLDEDGLFDDGDTISGLELQGDPVPIRRSLEYTFTFPAQEHKIGGRAVDPATETEYDVTVDDEHGLVTLCRSVDRADEPLPKALIPPEPLRTYVQRDAVLRFAGNRDDYPAVVEILERRPPRARLTGPLADAALSLDGSYLFVQGPPGSGKTWNGARIAIALMKAGRRVGVTALSHKAIHKFLEDVRVAALEDGFSFRGRKKGGGDPGSRYQDEFVDCTSENGEMLDPELQLLAGTSFVFAREDLDRHLDTLFVDEGGQFALADALAVGTSTRNLILLGDPNQLPQVSQGAHPPGANASVLAHLLGDDQTVRDEMGRFLELTWRMRPEVNAYVSEVFYEGRLEPAPVCGRRSLAGGNGIRFLPVEHAGHRQQAPEEAEAVRDEIARLLGTELTTPDGTRPLRPPDIVVVAPYNAHVRCLRQHIADERIRIGTVDKFQGQEAAVVFYSMASSSSEDVPRGLEFLFSRNRLNVAISRAQCLAYLVASPRLLEASCRTVDQMRLANSLCRLVEVATEEG